MSSSLVGGWNREFLDNAVVVVRDSRAKSSSLGQCREGNVRESRKLQSIVIGKNKRVTTRYAMYDLKSQLGYREWCCYCRFRNSADIVLGGRERVCRVMRWRLGCGRGVVTADPRSSHKTATFFPSSPPFHHGALRLTLHLPSQDA